MNEQNGTPCKSPPRPRGLSCAHCGCRHLPVVYTRHTLDGRILRRRQCRHCGRRVTTWEKIGG